MSRTDQQAFKEIIEKAIENGWDMFGYLKKGTIRAKNFKRYYFTNQNYTHTARDHDSWKMQQLSIESTTFGGYGAYLHIPVREIVFDHDFAKAFWGELPHFIKGTYEMRECTECGADDPRTDKCWEHYLQQMVLEEDPIKYLEQFLSV